MSAYDTQTGLFELTPTKLRYWFRHCKRLPEVVFQEYQSCISSEYGELLFVGSGEQLEQFVLDLFWSFGIEAASYGTWWKIKATPEQVWEVITGTESDPERARYYYGTRE